MGLTNLLLKRLARKGYLKFVHADRNRLLYVLTPQGLARKARLTYEYMARSLQRYREVRLTLRKALSPLAEGSQRVVLYGAGEVAEVAYLCVRELGAELAGVVEEGAAGRRFLSLPVHRPEHLPGMAYDRVVVAVLECPEAAVSLLVRLGVPQEKIVCVLPVDGAAGH